MIAASPIARVWRQSRMRWRMLWDAIDTIPKGALWGIAAVVSVGLYVALIAAAVFVAAYFAGT